MHTFYGRGGGGGGGGGRGGSDQSKKRLNIMKGKDHTLDLKNVNF